ncbi:MAG: EpsI family protein [Fimbriimonadales bacterium]|nr:EpsI family protein [Fimbriimonadales bacterium]
MNAVAARALVVSGLLLPAVVLQGSLASHRPSRSAIHESSLPENVDGWTSRPVPLTQEELSMLRSPAASQRLYTDSVSGAQVQVLLLQVGNTQNAHDPKICMRGSGYQLERSVIREVDWANASGRPSAVSIAEFRNGASRITLVSWMQTASDTVADMSAGLKWEGIRRALRGLPTRGIAVRIVCLPSAADGSPTALEVGAGLWRRIDGGLHIEQLARRL